MSMYSRYAYPVSTTATDYPRPHPHSVHGPYARPMSLRRLPTTDPWWLPWAVGVTFAAVGWLTPAQVAVTVTLEIVVAAHYARARTLLSEGVVLKDSGTLTSGEKSLTVRAGDLLTPDEREFYGGGMRFLLIFFAVGAAWAISVFSGFSGITWWAATGWLTWTATALWTERQRFVDWSASDAPTTADPTSHMMSIFARTITFFVAVFPVLILLPEQGEGDPSHLALALGSCILLTLDLVATEGPRRVVALLRGENPDPPHPAETPGETR